MYHEELIRRRFWEYCLYWDNGFFRSRPFLEEVALLMQDLDAGVIKRGAASMPPRSGKSYITTLFSTWWLGRHPDLCVMRNTVTKALYDKFSYDARSIIRENKYTKVFPAIRLSPDKQNLGGWSLTTSKQGAYFGAGVGGNIIGFGANLAITDDLYAGFKEALSPDVNEGTHVWKQGSHNSRMEKDCPELFIGTRWSQRDVIGAAMDDGQIEKAVVIPALTKDRKSFCEAVKSTEEYLYIEQHTDDMIFRAEYQQEPIEAFGLLFPLGDMLLFDMSNLPEEAEHHLVSIDPANKGGDYFCSVHCVLVGDAIYVPHVFCNKEGSDQNNILHYQYINERRIDQVEYEGVLQWRLTAEKLRDMLGDRELEFRITKPVVQKHTRILVEAPFIKKHFYFRHDYKQLPEYRIFMSILTAYLRDQSGTNAAKNDDPPDVLAAAAKFYKRNFGHLWPMIKQNQ